MANVPTSQLLAEQTLEGTINITGTGEKYKSYTGAYEIDPKVDNQVLETKQRSMEADLIVNAIHYDEVENLGGGKTATIGAI